MTIKELREKRAKLIADARAMLDAADKEKRELTTEEQTRWDGLMAESDTVKRQLVQRERLEAEERTLATSRGHRGCAPAAGAAHAPAGLAPR